MDPNTIHTKPQARLDSFGIQAELKRKKLRQKDIAAETKVSSTIVSRVINGTVTSRHVMDCIAGKLNVHASELWPDRIKPEEPDTA
jgi:lambda repressor-like predicted transcriptional regulator